MYVFFAVAGKWRGLHLWLALLTGWKGLLVGRLIRLLHSKDQIRRKEALTMPCVPCSY